MAKGPQVKDVLWYVAVAVLAFPVVPLFDHLGKPEFERPVYFFVMLIMVAVKVCWEVRHRVWFWVTITAVVGLHVPLLMLSAHWLFQMPFPAMLLFGFIDIAIILGVISAVEKIFDSKAESIEDRGF